MKAPRLWTVKSGEMIVQHESPEALIQLCKHQLYGIGENHGHYLDVSPVDNAFLVSPRTVGLQLSKVFDNLRSRSVFALGG